MTASIAPQPAKLVIVDDDPGILSQLSLALHREYDIHTAGNSKSAWQVVLQEHPDLVTLDLALDNSDPESGFSLLERCLAYDPFLKIVLITEQDNEANALRAIDQGAADFFSKPVDITELRILLRRMLVMARLERRNADLLRQLGEEQRLGELVGQSPEMRAVFARIEKSAAADVAVLILGESGTGKELVAKEIRRLSPRAAKPFVSINCGAIPETLVESELFGHERGAFTDARETRPGRLERAQGGIVFLDEIGDLPLSSQVKLLRFLQDHEFERIGGHEVISLDVRVLAATSKNLVDEVRKRAFREDLYYRVSVVEIRVPPLRERPDDILFLAQYFLDRSCSEFNRGRLCFSQSARLALQQHKWPGNVRELEHRIKRAVVMSGSRTIDVRDLDLELENAAGARPIPLRLAREEADRQTIVNALRHTSGNVSRAAEELGIARPSLHALMTRLRIRARDYRRRTGT